MSRNAEVYDLGDVDRALGRARPTAAPAPAPAAAPARKPRHFEALLKDRRVALFASDVTRSLSVFVPGATQIAGGRFGLGIFFLVSLAFMAALSSAVLETMDRLAPTLELLGQSIVIAFWTLGVAFLLAAAIHLSAVWTGLPPGGDRGRPSRHPVVPAVASFIVPGWGQVLNGNRLRAILFLAGCWLVAGAWIASSEATLQLFNTYFPVVAPWEQSARAPLVIWTLKWTTPLVVWSLAVYDAAASAVARRPA